MIVFLDESYEKDDDGCLRHAYAGFGVEEMSYRKLTTSVYQCKQHFFKERGTFPPEDEGALLKTNILCNGLVENVEIKAKHLLHYRTVHIDPADGTTPGYHFCDALLNTLSEAKATIFGVMSYPENLDAIQKHDRLPMQFIILMERIEMWMKERHPDGGAIIVPDTVHDGIDRRISHEIEQFLFRSVDGRRMRHIVPHPFWVDSQTTTGSQLADVVAHILLNQMRPPHLQKPLRQLHYKLLDMEFKGSDMLTRGIRVLKKRKQRA